MKQVFLSIITPTYNRANKLHIAFNSLMHQTNKNFQWIIIDDGSDDNTNNIVSKMIKSADFSIIYKKIKHSGKHIATRTAYKIASGKWSLELDSDDELFDENTIDNVYKLTKSLPNNYSCIGGCFIDQHNNIFPKIDADFYDFDVKKYLDYFCDAEKIKILNAPWIMKIEYAKSVLPPIIHDNLTYYPEAVINVARALKNHRLNIRLFNLPIYRYYLSNNDSVSVNTFKTNADWYYSVGLLDVFHKYKLLEKYPEFTERTVKKLFNAVSKNKNLFDVWKVLKNNNISKLFIKYFIKYLIKQFFSVKRAGKQRIITILGIKFKK